jgi:hypothetical protein
MLERACSDPPALRFKQRSGRLGALLAVLSTASAPPNSGQSATPHRCRQWQRTAPRQTTRWRDACAANGQLRRTAVCKTREHAATKIRQPPSFDGDAKRRLPQLWVRPAMPSTQPVTRAWITCVLRQNVLSTAALHACTSPLAITDNVSAHIALFAVLWCTDQAASTLRRRPPACAPPPPRHASPAPAALPRHDQKSPPFHYVCTATGPHWWRHRHSCSTCVTTRPCCTFAVHPAGCQVGCPARPPVQRCSDAITPRAAPAVS